MPKGFDPPQSIGVPRFSQHLAGGILA